MEKTLKHCMMIHDWSQFYPSADAIKEDLFQSVPGRENLLFQGEGWYFNMGDVLLVVSEDEGFRVFVWNTPDADPRDVLRALCALPRHVLLPPPPPHA